MVRDLGIRISLVTRIFMAMMMLIPALATALVYGIGGTLAVNGALTIGTLTALATLLLRLLGPLQGLSNVRVDVMTALVSFDRVFEVLDLPSTVQEKPDAVAAARRAPRGWSSTTWSSPTRAPTRSRWPSLETVARVEKPRQRPGAARRHLRRRARADDRARRAFGCRQDHDHPPGGAALRRHRRERCGSAGTTSAT